MIDVCLYEDTFSAALEFYQSRFKSSTAHSLNVSVT